MPTINSCEHIENNCAIFAMCGFPVTSREPGLGLRFDAISISAAWCRRGAPASRMHPARLDLAFSDGVRPISTLHGVVFAILSPAQRSTPSGTRPAIRISPGVQAEIVHAEISDMHGAANPAGVAKYPQIAVDFGRTAGGFLRVVRELHGWPAVDRRYLAND
jgi:hypothetical protein